MARRTKRLNYGGPKQWPPRHRADTITRANIEHFLATWDAPVAPTELDAAIHFCGEGSHRRDARVETRHLKRVGRLMRATAKEAIPAATV